MNKVLRIWGLPVLFFTLMDGVLLQWTHRHSNKNNNADDRLASETTIDLPIEVLQKVLPNDKVTIASRMLQDDEQRLQKNNVNPTVKNPYFIFHVGPPKTASSTIQCGLAKYSRELAMLDGYYYLGKPCAQYPLRNNETAVRGKFLEIELRQTKKAADKPTVQILQNRLAFHWRQGHHVIVSAENFHYGLLPPSGWKLLTTALLQHWQVRIVVTYRLPSLFYQQYKKKPLASLLAFLQQNIDDATKHPVRATFDQYSRHFSDIHIFNLHQQGDVITNFICQVLPTAPHVCRQLVQQLYRNAANDEQEMRVRESRSFDAHKLVSAAKSRGLVSKKPVLYNRMVQKLAVRLEQFQESNFTNYTKYVTCLSPYWTERLLNLSLAFEEDVASISSYVESLLVSSHEDELQINVAKRKYCEVDTKLVLDASDTTFAHTMLDGL